MPSKKTILIDCDGTIITDVCTAWFGYLLSHYTLNSYGQSLYLKGEQYPYDLTEMFDLPEGVDKLEFWKDAFLYDNKHPREDAVRYIPMLKDLGYNIVFCSKVVPEHTRSKTEFISRHFPCNDGILFTSEKHYVKADIVIDDTYAVLNSFEDGVLCLKFRSDYKEKVLPKKDYQVVYNWKDLYNLIEQITFSDFHY